MQRRKSRVLASRFKRDPSSVGTATAEFFPADPVVWLEAAALIGMQVSVVDGRTLMYWQHAETNVKNFLMSWLFATPHGEEAVRALLMKRNAERPGD